MNWLIGFMAFVVVCEILFLMFFPWGLEIDIEDEVDKIINADFSEIEKRILSHMESGAKLIDIHKERAAIHFGIPIKEITEDQRVVGRQLNFRNMYGERKGTITGRFKACPKKYNNIIDVNKKDTVTGRLKSSAPVFKNIKGDSNDKG